MAEAHQTFPREQLADLAAAVAAGLNRLPDDLTGKRIAVTAGSRGICRITELLRLVIDGLKQRGAEPFIVPSMGSHGGATSAGQRALLAGYGITEQSMGVPILDSMDAVCIGTTPQGVDVFCQSDALAADGILVINKVKPHADFKADIESGLCKMMVIGLGKHKGCTELHRWASCWSPVQGCFWTRRRCCSASAFWKTPMTN